MDARPAWPGVFHAGARNPVRPLTFVPIGRGGGAYFVPFNAFDRQETT